MSETEEKPKEAPGWVTMFNAKKVHYIGVDRRSLCGKWSWLGKPQGNWKPHDSDACKACLKRLPKP